MQETYTDGRAGQLTALPQTQTVVISFVPEYRLVDFSLDLFRWLC